MRWAAEKIVRKCSVPGVVFGSGQAEPQRTIPFFAEIARRSFGRTGGREYSNLKSLKEKTSTRTQKAFCLCTSSFRFLGYFITLGVNNNKHKKSGHLV